MNDRRPESVGRMRRRILLSSYNTGATAGRNLGIAGYSYDFVAQLFRPLLEQCGEVVALSDPAAELEPAVREAHEQGVQPIHISFVPFQDAVLSDLAPNVVVPAWEFPDVPDHAFDGNPRNDWVATANRCALVIVGGEFTANALLRAGVRRPVRIVPVPTPEPYFRIGPARAADPPVLDFEAYVFGPSEGPALIREPAADAAKPRRHPLRSVMRTAYRGLIKPLLPETRRRRLVTSAVVTYRAWRDPEQFWPVFARKFDVPYQRSPAAALGRGVVYTSILNPADGRKNWEDLLTGFLYALGDRDDATLIVKLINKEPFWIKHVLDFFRGIGRPHRCTVAFVSDYLRDDQMLDLAEASTYYVTTTRAEGNCLPLMNYLAAGRPAISPRHSAISDYFDERVGFVVDSHPEPTAWPHDSRWRRLTTWHRLVWTSLVDQLRLSYAVARDDPDAYEAMAARARATMAARAAAESVLPRLLGALDAIENVGETDVQAA